MSKQTTHSLEETYTLAAEFAKGLKGGELVALIGDLGSGKTTFVRGVVKALGSKARVKSPTFTVMNEYPVGDAHPEQPQGVERSQNDLPIRDRRDVIKRIVHVDLYRFKDPAHLSGIELGEVMRDDTVVFVEWPDIFGEMFAKPDREVRFVFVDEQTRDIQID